MKNLLQKKVNKKGFTLAELLVVVAIIAVLVAVSIPIFTGQLDKAKESTDAANLRAGKAAAVNAYMESPTTGAIEYYYDAAKGVVVKTKAEVTDQDYCQTTEGAVVKINITADGAVTADWE